MKTLQWSREEAARLVLDRIWLYVSPSSSPESLAVTAAALFQLSEADIQRLARLYFLTSSEVALVLEEAPHLLRRLPTNSSQFVEYSTDRIRGAINWPLTLAARHSSGIRNTYATMPAQRIYQTPENELLVFVLRTISQLSKELSWPEATPLGARIMTNRAISDRLLENRMLSSVTNTRPTPRSLARVRSGRHKQRFDSSRRCFELYESLYEHLDRQRLREAIEKEALLIATDSILFEIVCLFTLLDSFSAMGWAVPTLKVFAGGLHTRLLRGSQSMDVWYQCVPPEMGRISAYSQIQRAHEFANPSPLRPDIILRMNSGDDPGKWLLTEIKMGYRARVDDYARRALADLLAYRTSFEKVDFSVPYGLGIAWGEDLAPVEGPIMLTTPDHLTEALSLYLADHYSPPHHEPPAIIG